MRADKIPAYIRDAVALLLGSGGFINEMLKKEPDPWLLILFFAMVLAPMPFAFLAMRQHGTEPPTLPPAAPPTPGPPSGSPPPQPQPSSSPTS